MDDLSWVPVLRGLTAARDLLDVVKDAGMVVPLVLGVTLSLVSIVRRMIGHLT